jgi:MFS family permease
MYGLWQAVARYPLGIISDSVGRRKPFIIGGLLLGGVGAFVMMNAQGATGLIIGRGITGLAAATWVLLMVGFSSLFPPDQAVKASATLMIINAVGRTIATGINGKLNALGGYALAFEVAMVASVLAAIFFLPVKDPVRPKRKPNVRSIGKLSLRPDVLIPALLAAIIQFACWAAVFGFIPILGRGFGATDNQLSLMSMLNILVGVGGNFLITRVIHKVGTKPVLLVGITLIALALALVALSNSLAMLFVSMIMIGLGSVSLSTLMGLSIRYVGEAERSTAMGLHQSVYGFGMFFGPYLSGFMAEAIGVQEMFWVLFAVVIIGGYAGTFIIHGIEQRIEKNPALVRGMK